MADTGNLLFYGFQQIDKGRKKLPNCRFDTLPVVRFEKLKGSRVCYVCFQYIIIIKCPWPSPSTLSVYSSFYGFGKLAVVTGNLSNSCFDILTVLNFYILKGSYLF